MSDAQVIETALVAAAESSASPTPASSSLPSQLSHARCQAVLAKLGSAMKCEVWIPKSDRAKVAEFGVDRILLPELPFVFGGAVHTTVSNIDALWFRGRTIIAAFEVEHSTAIYSGLLRMADLVTVLPNLDIPFYVCAPSKRTPDVAREIQRPTFAAFHPPLATRCRLVTYEALTEFVDRTKPETLEFMDPAAIKTIATAFL